MLSAETDFEKRNIRPEVVGFLLVLKVALFYVSLTDTASISFFCTASASSWLQIIGGLVHLAFIPLFGFGIISLFKPPLRRAYVLLTCIALISIPIQLVLLTTGLMYCAIL